MCVAHQTQKMKQFLSKKVDTGAIKLQRRRGDRSSEYRNLTINKLQDPYMGLNLLCLLLEGKKYIAHLLVLVSIKHQDDKNSLSCWSQIAVTVNLSNSVCCSRVPGENFTSAQVVH